MTICIIFLLLYMVDTESKDERERERERERGYAKSQVFYHFMWCCASVGNFDYNGLIS